MRTLTAVAFLMCLAGRAPAKLELLDVQATHGPLGTERKSSEYVAGDEVYYRFAIAGAQVDDNGRLRGELRLSLADSKGKILDKTENAIQQLPALGSESFAAGASWSLGLGFAAGEYEITVEFADLISKESVSFRRKFKVKPVEFALIRVRFHHDLDERVPARAGGIVGQNLAIKLSAIGFDRSKDLIDVEMEIQVLDAQGKGLLPKPIKATVHNEKPREVKEIERLNFSGLLTLNRPGDFMLRVTVTDTMSGKKLVFESPLKVSAP